MLLLMANFCYPTSQCNKDSDTTLRSRPSILLHIEVPANYKQEFDHGSYATVTRTDNTATDHLIRRNRNRSSGSDSSPFRRAGLLPMKTTGTRNITVTTPRNNLYDLMRIGIVNIRGLPTDNDAPKNACIYDFVLNKFQYDVLSTVENNVVESIPRSWTR